MALIGGWPTPLKNIRQIIIPTGENNPFMFQTTNQLYIYISLTIINHY